MKVYLVYKIDAEPYSRSLTGVHKVFSNKEDAKAFVKENRWLTFGSNSEGRGGFIISPIIEEFEVK